MLSAKATAPYRRKLVEERKQTRAPGAGVKAEDGCTQLERRQIRIDPESVAILARIGKGNLSLGIREATRRVVEAGDVRPFSAARHEKRRK